MESSSSDGLHKFKDSNGRTTGPTRRSTKGQWTVQEDEMLRKAVQQFKGKNWKKIAECIKDRSDVQCLHRWQKVLDPELVKGPWTKEEDEELIRLVGEYGATKWSTIAKHLTGRIGKQCRERWHNHLNPEINKEAWTQEEELMLIQAHRVYGNKWAELTKFLPGRTDNSIKNHWNSSVKKKLDTYFSSGLLLQLKSLPSVSHTNQSTPTSSRTQQGSTEVEEISECSQGSSFMRCSESNNDLVKEMVVYTGEEDQSAGILKVTAVDETQLPVDSNHVNDPSSSPNESQPCGLANPSNFVSSSPSFMRCSESNNDMVKEMVVYTGEEDQSAGILKVTAVDETQLPVDSNHVNDPTSSPNESQRCGSANPSNFIEQNYSHDLENPPIDSRGETEFLHCIDIDQNQEAATHSIPNSEVNKVFGSDIATQMMTPENDCSRSSNSLFYQQSNCQIPHAPTLSSLSYHSEVLGAASYSQPPLGPSNSGSNQFNGSSVGNQVAHGINNDTSNTLIFNDQDNVWSLDKKDQVTDFLDLSAGGFSSGQFHATQADENNVLDTCIFNDQDDVLTLDKTDQVMDPLDVVSADGFSSGQLHATQADEKNVLETQQQDTRFLSYEPPRFPSLDSPFLTCDLIESGGDLELEYSPLGIRQLMMSSMNCYSPCRLWDPPSHHDSPEAVLKSASKTFKCTPSILKKRNRDLLSPLSEKRNFTFFNSPKDLNQAYGNESQQLPSSSQSVDSGAIITEDKENLNPDDEMVQKEGGKNTTINMQQPAGVCVEQNLDGDLGNDTSVEILQRFEETPLKKSSESPSSWKSPWLSFQSPSAWKSPWLPFTPGPRVDTDITIEDIGYFTSPGEKSYDALGLMKQLSERTASAYANAREVLGDETPDSILKKRLSEKSRRESNILSERRVLDFTECGSPMKREQNARHSSGVSFSSPSSYLLKGCR